MPINRDSALPQSFARPTIAGTLAILLSLGFASAVLGQAFTAPSEVAQAVAWIVGLGLVTSLAFDSQLGLQAVVRTDVICLLSLYGLVLAERLNPDEAFDLRNTLAATEFGITLTLWAFAGLAIGRHLVIAKPRIHPLGPSMDLPISWVMRIMTATFLVAILHILLSTKFDLIRVYDGLVSPRFARPWARGRIGGLHTLINELALFFYVIPPLTAIVVARWREVPPLQRWLALSMCFFVFFEAFAGGTRNVLLTHMISFCGAYLLLLGSRISYKQVSLVLACFLTFSAFSIHHMLEFRQVGLKRYLQNELYNSPEARDSLFVDDNLSSISKLTSTFPEPYNYLGWEIPYWAVIKPIPRVLWPGKPEKLSVSIEEALNGSEGYTIATTFIGEAFMAFGLPGVICFALFFGSLSANWNRFAGSCTHSMQIVIFASGFFAAAITMRSMIWMTTAMLPTVALVIGWQFYLRPRLISQQAQATWPLPPRSAQSS